MNRPRAALELRVWRDCAIPMPSARGRAGLAADALHTATSGALCDR